MRKDNKMKPLLETAVDLGYLNHGGFDLKESVETTLDKLTFDMVINTFKDNYKNVKFTRTQPNGEEGPYYNDSINFPNGDDSSTSIGDMNALETWKAEMEQRYGNFAILLKPEADNWFDKVEIVDDKFTKQKDDFIKGKQAWADKEMAAGRSID